MYRLLPAFNSSTGMPYGTGSTVNCYGLTCHIFADSLQSSLVNLRHGVPVGETPV